MTKPSEKSPYADFETDGNLEREGVWIDFPNYRIKLASAGPGNPRYEARRAAVFKPYRYKLQHGTLEEEVALPLLIGVYCDCVVLDWQDMKDREGTPLEFSRENALKLFKDLPRLFAAVVTEAERLANFRSEEREEAIKN